MTIVQPSSYAYLLDFDNKPELLLGFVLSPSTTYKVQESADLVTWTDTHAIITGPGNSKRTNSVHVSLRDGLAVRVVTS